MSKHIEQLLLASNKKAKANRAFTKQVMRQLTQEQRQSKNRFQSIVNTFRLLPRTALLAIVAGGVLVTSGTAYAAYNLWLQPSVRTTQMTSNENGRTQVSLSLNQCGDHATQTNYEIKRGSTIEATEVADTVKAHCQLSAITQWGIKNGIITPPSTTDRSWKALSFSAFLVESINDSELSFKDENGVTQQRSTVNAQFFNNAAPATRSDIRTNDSILLIEASDRDGNTSVTHVLKMDLAPKYYGTAMQSQIIERINCPGNPNESCLNGGANVDLYEKPTVATNDPSHTTRRIQGKLTSHNGTTATITTSSGKQITVTLPDDVITIFNTTKSPAYNDTVVALGDMLDITYREKTNEYTAVLTEKEIVDINFMIDIINKNDPLKKY